MAVVLDADDAAFTVSTTADSGSDSLHSMVPMPCVRRMRQITRQAVHALGMGGTDLLCDLPCGGLVCDATMMLQVNMLACASRTLCNVSSLQRCYTETGPVVMHVHGLLVWGRQTWVLVRLPESDIFTHGCSAVCRGRGEHLRMVFQANSSTDVRHYT